jgi:hypothetical protein
MRSLVVSELLEGMDGMGWLGHHRVVDGAPMDTGAKPWTRRLGLMRLDEVRENQLLGVRYWPVQALASSRQRVCCTARRRS